jgi:hypothetical protein
MANYGYVQSAAGTVHLTDDNGLAICRSAEVRGGKVVEPCPDWTVCVRCLATANRVGIVRLYCDPQTAKVLAFGNNGSNWLKRAVAARWIDVLCNSLKSESDWLDAYKSMTESEMPINVEPTHDA